MSYTEGELVFLGVFLLVVILMMFSLPKGGNGDDGGLV